MKILMVAKKTVDGIITEGKQYAVEDFTDSLYMVKGDNGKYAIVKEHFESPFLNSVKQIANKADELAKKERERVRDNVLNAPFVGGAGWRIHREGDVTFADIKSNNFQPNAYFDTLDELRKILRVPEGDNILTHARMVRELADVLIKLQK
ncbi:putative GntR-family transcriptional regulator [Pseudomonas phage Motto]|nr:putative GntR-family transcriptional regulator [Pseudomonas phage Motto]